MNFLQWGITILVISRNCLKSERNLSPFGELTVPARGGSCCCHPEICALLGWWQSTVFPPGLMWGRAGASPIAFLGPSGHPSWLPAAEQLCQPEQGLPWGNKDQMPSLCTKSQAPRAVGQHRVSAAGLDPPEPWAGVRAVLPRGR